MSVKQVAAATRKICILRVPGPISSPMVSAMKEGFACTLAAPAREEKNIPALHRVFPRHPKSDHPQIRDDRSLQRLSSELNHNASKKESGLCTNGNGSVNNPQQTNKSNTIDRADCLRQAAFSRTSPFPTRGSLSLFSLSLFA